MAEILTLEGYAFRDGEAHKRIDKMRKTYDASIEELKNKQVNLEYVTPEMFGAVGDRETDDSAPINQMIQYAIANNKHIRAFRNYRIISPIVFENINNTNIEFYGEINYTGSEQAIIIKSARRNTFNFTIISANNGSCIKIESYEGSADCVIYNTFNFKYMYALNHCFHMEIGETGYVNENVISNGWFAGGQTGVYANAPSTNPEIQFKCNSVGIEGVELGFHLINTSGCELYSPRYQEADKLIKAEGKVTRLMIVSSHKLENSLLELSDDTQGFVLAPMTYDEGTFNASVLQHIYEGLIIPTHPIKYIYTADSVVNLADTNYLETPPVHIMATTSCNELRLSKAYGNFFGINEFIVYFNMPENHNFTIYDRKDEIVCTNGVNLAYKYVRFTWSFGLGWFGEIIEKATLT